MGKKISNQHKWSNCCWCGSNRNRTYSRYVFGSDDTLSAYIYYTGSAWAGQLTSTKTFRDPTAWYHIVLVVDTTEAASSVRIKMWVNGSQIQDLSTAAYPDQNQDLLFNSAVNHEIGSATVSGGSRGNFLMDILQSYTGLMEQQ